MAIDANKQRSRKYTGHKAYRTLHRSDNGSLVFSQQENVDPRLSPIVKIITWTARGLGLGCILVYLLMRLQPYIDGRVELVLWYVTLASFIGSILAGYFGQARLYGAYAALWPFEWTRHTTYREVAQITRYFFQTVVFPALVIIFFVEVYHLL
ncbi:MAG: hypothetical protein JSU74_13780 [Candidatus Zixiibacteriota bacterium]|nr:MAG: hypothetical protein JSU74_13780 [candidate division Zixibacteria bacterium]